MGTARRFTNILVATSMAIALLAPPAQAVDLDQATAAAFDHYLQVTQARIDDDLRGDRFLYIDRLPAADRAKIDARLRKGELYIEELHTLEHGRPIRIPNGTIHHWIGIAFIPHDGFTQAVNVLQDYQKYQQIYQPDIRRSKLLEHNGNTWKIYLQLYKKSLTAVTLNANFDTSYRILSDTRGEFSSYSTRIAEVKNSGSPDERELAVGKDHGYLWRLDSFWRIEQTDGGVYLQVETIALSRNVPVIFGWIVRSLSRSIIANLLNSTVKAVTSHNAATPDPGRSETRNSTQPQSWRKSAASK